MVRKHFRKKIGAIVLILPALLFFVSTDTVTQTARLSVSIIDAETELKTPVRVRLTDSTGRPAPLPQEAIGIMWGYNDQAFGYGFQPDSSFYVDGYFEVELQPGRYNLSLSKGQEYLRQDHTITINSGEELSRAFALERWINMPDRGWYSADDHIHIRRSPRENPLILKWIAAEDIHIGAMLQMGDFWATYYTQYAWGKDGVYQIEDRLLTTGQEDPRTHEIGHTISLGASGQVRFRNGYYEYDRVFDRVHELGGLTGYAHQGMLFHGHWGMTLDVLRHKVDFLELLQFCVPDGPVQLDHYYHFLDLGFKLTATAGSDFPWCGAGENFSSRIGNARFYTLVGDTLDFDSWKESFRSGHTFVSSGPVIDFRVNGRFPGDDLNVTRGSKLTITAVASGHEDQVPLRKLEIVAHGEVIKSVSYDQPGQSSAELQLEMTLPVEKGLWIAARTEAGPYQTAHTTPVYITVDGGSFHNPETAMQYLDLNEQYLSDLETVISERDDREWLNAWRYEEELSTRIEEARKIIESLRQQYR